jgi:hypothetical protein
MSRSLPDVPSIVHAAAPVFEGMARTAQAKRRAHIAFITQGDSRPLPTVPRVMERPGPALAARCPLPAAASLAAWDAEVRAMTSQFSTLHLVSRVGAIDIRTRSSYDPIERMTVGGPEATIGPGSPRTTWVLRLPSLSACIQQPRFARETSPMVRVSHGGSRTPHCGPDSLGERHDRKSAGDRKEHHHDRLGFKAAAIAIGIFSGSPEPE